MIRRLFPLGLALLFLTAWCPWAKCHVKPSAVTLWDTLIRQCANSDVLGNSYIFLGPATAFSPGDVIVKASNGGYGLRYQLKEIAPDTSSYVARPTAPAACASKTTIKWDSSVGVPFANQLGGLSASVATDLSGAQNSTVTITGYEWASLRETDFEQLIDSLNSKGSPYARDLLQANAYVIDRALLVDGVSATFDFSQASATALKAKFSTPVIHAAETGVDLSVKWTTDSQLQLTATAPFYIAAVPATYQVQTVAVSQKPAPQSAAPTHGSVHPRSERAVASGANASVRMRKVTKLTPVKVDPMTATVSLPPR